MEEKKGFYEQKGMVRHTLILSEAHKKQLKELSKTAGITQGDLIEVLIDFAVANDLSEAFETKRNSRSDGRTTLKSALTKKLKDLSPEQLAAIEKIVGK